MNHRQENKVTCFWTGSLQFDKHNEYRNMTNTNKLIPGVKTQYQGKLRHLMQP